MNASSADEKPRPWRNISPLAIATLAVALVLGTLVIWLSLADGAPEPNKPEVVVELPAMPEGGETHETPGPGNVAFHLDPPAAGGEPELQQIGALAPILPGESLKEAPFPGLFEETPTGRLPIIASDGRRAVASYARPHKSVTDASGTPFPRIAVLVTGLGLNRNFAAHASQKLPARVTLGFTPYATDLDAMIAMAREEGHEAVLELPMEPFDYPDSDPGPYTLLSSLPAAANKDRLQWLLGRASGYFAVVNRSGGRYLSQPEQLGATLAQLRARGLGFIDRGASARSVTPDVAASTGIEWALGDVIIDDSKAASRIDRKLAELEQVAAENGTALGIATGLPITVDRIADWAEALPDKGFDLVPVSVILAARSQS